ncbi:hypothetical protein MSHOH_3004 [Methanosarcina horonobensis HB-1 = JCM 15518]|uniref:Uncharacterized protein n=2 Tax=Methanosarcina horonobensis TaxID=418008 RepID=A0A0E3SGJ2_9EURY|nr:hypothetical protein MSHOH_3004 [Methanosarcina horonobensis HB-1 = JCM 15518]
MKIQKSTSSPKGWEDMNILNPGKIEREDKSAVFKSEYEGKTYCFFSFSYRKDKWNLRHHLELRGGV